MVHPLMMCIRHDQHQQSCCEQAGIALLSGVAVAAANSHRDGLIHPHVSLKQSTAVKASCGGAQYGHVSCVALNVLQGDNVFSPRCRHVSIA